MMHRDRVLDQFTQQAVPFSEAPSMRDEAAIQLLIDAARTESTHRTLDVACGPGLVALAFARVATHATGVDATPAMLARAKELAQRECLRNTEFLEADATHLPFEEETFDVATCRFAFHHFEAPLDCLREMIRVTKRGGSIVVCDGVADADPAKAQAFNVMERLRDPSTVGFHTLAALRALFTDCGLTVRDEIAYRVPAELEGLMRVSFPAPGDAQRVREIILHSITTDALGMGTRREGERVLLHYPAVILASTKP